MRYLDSLNAILSTQWLRDIRLLKLISRPGTSIAGFALSVLRPQFRRRQIDKAIAQSEQLFAVFMDNLPGYAWMKDRAGRYLYVNRAVMSLAPFQNGWLGKTDIDIWPGEAVATFRANDLKVIATGEKVETIESFTLNGEKCHLLVTKFPIFDEHGTVTMVGGSSVDITEHQRVEEALRESEGFRHMIIESQPECVKLVAPDYTLLDINPAGLEMFGATSREQVVGQSVLNLVAPEFRSTYVGMHQRVCQGESVVAEFEIVGLQGSRRRMECHAAPLRDQQSRVVARLAITRDVTEGKRAEEQLRLSERQLAEAQRIAQLGSWSWDLTGETQIWSDELYRIYGLPPGNGQPSYEAFLELVHVEDRLMLAESVADATRTRKPIDINLRISRPDGEERIIHSRAQIVYDDQGNPSRLFGTAQDVTEYRRAEEAQRSAELKYRDIFEKAVEGIFQTTPDGRFISANPALARMYGFDSPEELINTRTDIARDLYVDPNSREEFKQSLEEEGFIADFEIEAYRKDGSKIWISENVRAVRDQAGKVVYYEGTTQDITARKLAEQALRESEERYRKLFENAKDGIYVHDLSGRYTSVNRAIERLSGYSREEILGKDSSSFVVPEYLGHVQQNFCKKLRQEGETSYEVEIVTKDGRRVPVEVNSNLIFENGSPVGVQALVRDITERRFAEQAIRQAEQKFRGIFENAGEGIFQTTPDGRYIAANPALARMLGFNSPEELISDCNDITRQIYVDSTRREEFKRLLEASGAVRGFEHQAFRKDGSKIWIAVNARAVRDDQRQILYYEGTAQDVTERKRAEQALTESEGRKDAILKSALDCVITIDHEGTVIDFNPAAEQTFGYASESIVGKKMIDLIIPPAERSHHKLGFDSYLATGCSSMLGKRIEVSALRSDGSEFPVELTVTAIGELPRPTFTAFIRDLTERKRVEAAFKNYSRLLIKAQEAERENIAGELHDQIGQLLTAIRINLQAVRDSAKTVKSKTLTDEGMTLVDHALGQVRDLSFELRPSLLDDLGLISALGWYADRYTQRTGIKTRRVIELAGKRLPRELETACFRIVQEALTNVARHAGAKEVVINLQILNNEILLSIKDNGCGFDTSSINSRSFPIRLGLRGMEERTLALGGRLTIESAAAKGTEILAYYPNEESMGSC